MSDHSHEQLCREVDIIFEEVLNNYLPDHTTPQHMEQVIYNYIKNNFNIGIDENLYVKILIGDITYKSISDILDGLIFHKILEKCCKYNETNKIMLTVLITNLEEDNSQ